MKERAQTRTFRFLALKPGLKLLLAFCMTIQRLPNTLVLAIGFGVHLFDHLLSGRLPKLQSLPKQPQSQKGGTEHGKRRGSGRHQSSADCCNNGSGARNAIEYAIHNGRFLLRVHFASSLTRCIFAVELFHLPISICVLVLAAD